MFHETLHPFAPKSPKEKRLLGYGQTGDARRENDGKRAAANEAAVPFGGAVGVAPPRRPTAIFFVVRAASPFLPCRRIRAAKTDENCGSKFGPTFFRLLSFSRRPCADRAVA